MATRDAIPPHLRQFVVTQDPSAYDEIDHDVWRFVLLQMHHWGGETAHPVYRDGLGRTGISVERIPSIEHMDRCLGEFGWGAVAVDGFIPPRAFQEFQALGILTIAAAIRRPEHLAYTPAPDIIHESAGHAPIIPDPDYSAYLRRFGEIGARAFSLPEDRAVYRAIRALSELKEDAATSAEAIAAATSELAEAERSAQRLSEASLLSRLHWWTVEYGLIGTPEAYKLYGAGLLSSLGESHALHGSHVRKLPLTARCVDVAYDITAPQPQLFVAESFAQLHAVLDEVAAGLAQQAGGRRALQAALEAREVATVELSSGLQLIGVLDQLIGTLDAPAYLRLAGPCALSLGGKILGAHGVEAHPEGFGLPLGRLSDGTTLEGLRPSELERRITRRSSGSAGSLDVDLVYDRGVRVQGQLAATHCDAAGRVCCVTLQACRVTRGDELLFDPDWGAYDLALGSEIVRAYAGPADASYWPESTFSQRRVPRPKQRTPRDERMVALYERALDLWRHTAGAEQTAAFEQVHAELRAYFPEDWLLRWNLLECLRKRGEFGALGAALRRELLAIEELAPAELPVSSGLRYLDQVYGAMPRGSAAGDRAAIAPTD